MRVAACAFPIQAFASFAEFAERVRDQVRQAAEADARIVVFPEYMSGSLLTLTNDWQAWEKPCDELFTSQAREFRLFVLGGTRLVRDGDRLLNRAIMYAPSGAQAQQDKLHLTPWEKRWHLSPGDGLTIIDLPGVRVAILICYDIEFPQVSALAAAQGVDLILVPSWTDDRHGYWRVRYCCHARTVEQQLFVAHAPLVGGNPALPEFEQANGRAGILTPCDTPFAVAGIAAESGWDQAGMAIADVDLTHLAAIRRAGSVTPRHDAKPAHDYRIAGVIDLRI